MPEITEVFEHRPTPYGRGVIRGYLLCTLAFTAILLIVWAMIMSSFPGREDELGIPIGWPRQFIESMDLRLGAGFALTAVLLGRWVMNPRIQFLIPAYLFVPLTGAFFLATWWATDPSFKAEIDLYGAVILGVIAAHALIWPFFFSLSFVIAARWFLRDDHDQDPSRG